MYRNLPFCFVILFFFSFSAFSQVDEDKIGAWYMYFWNTTFSESKVGLQGDIQYRNWNLVGDLEQLLLRGGPYLQSNGHCKINIRIRPYNFWSTGPK